LKAFGLEKSFNPDYDLGGDEARMALVQYLILWAISSCGSCFIGLNRSNKYFLIRKAENL
jgi:hypothetical protein